MGSKTSCSALLCVLLVYQLSDVTAAQFFTRFLTRDVQSPRLQVVDNLIKGRGPYEHLPLPPQRNISGPVRVLFSLGLIRIVDFDEDNAVLTFVGLERYNWIDLSMAYSDKNKAPLALPKEGMWLPDLKVIGSLDPSLDYDPSVRPLVYGSGEILYLSKVKHVIGCVPSQSREYTCTLTYNSWHYSSNQLEPDFYGQRAAWDMSNVFDHPRWVVSGQEARRNVNKYHGNTDIFVDLRYTLRIRRK